MTLFRYIFREFIPPFVYSLSLIIFLFVLNLLFQMLGKIAGKGLPLNTVVEFFALNLAWMVALAVPMAVLVAVLTTYGQMSSAGEITALKSSGVGQLRLLTPALFMGILMFVLLALFNNELLPDVNHRSRQLQHDIRRKKPTMILEPGVFLSDIPGHVMIARDVNQETSEVQEVVVYQENDPAYSSTVSADHGILRFEEAAEAFEFLLNDGQIIRTSRRNPGEFQRTDFKRAVFRIDAPGIALRRTDSDWKGDRELDVAGLLARIREYEEKDADRHRRSINSLKVEVHKKFSIPAACIVFAILGTMLGQIVRKSGLGVSAGYSIAFFLVYWIFLIGGEDLADRGAIRPWMAMWAPNIIFFVIGLILLWIERRGRGFSVTQWFGRIFSKPASESN